MNYYCYCVILGVGCLIIKCFGFTLSPLQNLVLIRSLMGSLQRSISYEVMDNGYMIDFMKKISVSLEKVGDTIISSSQNSHSSNILFDVIDPSTILSIASIVWFIQIHNPSSVIRDEKMQLLSSVEIKPIVKKIRMFLLVVLFVMTKNVYNAI